jgi:hypothetical protein
MDEATKTTQQLQGWFAGRVPDGWFTSPPQVAHDRDEIVVVGSLTVPDLGSDASEDATSAALSARIEGFREDTRVQRMKIADEAQARFGLRVSWGAEAGGITALFTVAAIPAMTRLRMAERKVLDTLVDSGVARSRSHALAWCVRLVAEHQGEWLADLREALTHVEQVREQGPETG